MSHPESQLQTEMPDYGTSRIEPHTPQPEPAKLGPAQRLIGVLFSPGETFADINRKPTWLAPLLIAIVLAVGSSLFFNWWVNPDWNRIARDMIRQQVSKGGPELTEDQILQRVEGFKIVGKLFPVIAAVMTPILVLVMAGVFALGMMLMQAQTTFKKILSVVAWSFCGVTSLVSSIVTNASLAVRDRESLDAINPIDPGSISATHLGVLFGSDASPVIKALASSVDLFTIWMIILLAIGLAAVGGSRKITKGKTATLVVSLWLVLVLLKVLGAVAGGGR